MHFARPYVLQFLQTLTLRFGGGDVWWLSYVLIRDALLVVTLGLSLIFLMPNPYLATGLPITAVSFSPAEIRIPATVVAGLIALLVTGSYARRSRTSDSDADPAQRGGRRGREGGHLGRWSPAGRYRRVSRARRTG
jgi:hypothetical protein